MRHQRIGGDHVARAVGLGRQEAIAALNGHDFQIVTHHAGFQRVEAHIDADLGMVLRQIADRLGDHVAGFGLHVEGHRILKVEDHGIGAGRHRLVGPALAVPGNEQQ